MADTSSWTKNEAREFVGVVQLVQKHSEQVENFQRWAEEESWCTFHHSHYDWWSFPIDLKSSHGFAFSIFEEEIKDLQMNLLFMNNFKTGVRLLALSWGWDLYECREIEERNRGREQKWQNWGVRLFKAHKSSHLLGCTVEARSLATYAKLLLSRGKSLSFGPYDYTDYFKASETERGSFYSDAGSVKETTGSTGDTGQSEPQDRAGSRPTAETKEDM